jgi:uncharacterized protein YxeA
MRKIIIFLIISLIICQQSIFVYAEENENQKFNKFIKQNNSESSVIDMISSVNQSNIIRILTDFLNFGPKDTGSQNCRETAEYIYTEFKNMGLNVRYEDWKYVSYQDRNVVATLNGTDPESDAVFIICAHYDTIDNSPGANDDGSGIAAMIETARILSKYHFNHTIKFIAFSGHEVGLYGSFAYAKKAYFENENIIAALMLDMIGNTTKAGNVIQIHKTQRVEWISQIIQKTCTKYRDKINIVAEEIINTACDEKSFLDLGYNGIVFIQPNCWELPDHCPEDDLDTINFPFLTNATKLILATTVELLEKTIDIQVRFTEPKECHLYVYDKIKIKLPGFNLKRGNMRARTYIFGETTFKINITTDEEINAVYYTLDNELIYNRTQTEPPYELKMQKPCEIKNRLKYIGYHKIGVTVTTFSGKTAYDEMDVFVIKL